MKLRKIDRLDAWMRKKELTDAALSREAGLSNGLLNKSRKPGHDLSRKTIAAIVNRYPELDEKWLNTGAGTMNDSRVNVAQLVKEISFDSVIDNKSLEFLLNDIIKKNGFIESALEEIAKVNMLVQKSQVQIDALLELSQQRNAEIESIKNAFLEYNKSNGGTKKVSRRKRRY